MVLYCSFCNLLGAKISKEIINIKDFFIFFSFRLFTKRLQQMLQALGNAIFR